MSPLHLRVFFLVFFFLETNTHTQVREKEVLTQRHTTTSLKSHGNFLHLSDYIQSFEVNHEH